MYLFNLIPFPVQFNPSVEVGVTRTLSEINNASRPRLLYGWQSMQNNSPQCTSVHNILIYQILTTL